MAMISFWAAEYSNIVVCFWFVCLFVCLCLTRAFHRREKFVLVLFFRKKEISIFTISHIEFYLAIYNLWLLLIMGFGPVGGRGGAGGYTRGQKVGVGVSPSIRARAKVVRQHWQGKSIQICSFFRRIMGVAMASGLNQWAEWTSGLSHAPSKLWRHCCNAAISASVSFFFFFFWFSFFFQSTHSTYLRSITFRPQSGYSVVFFAILSVLRCNAAHQRIRWVAVG